MLRLLFRLKAQSDDFPLYNTCIIGYLFVTHLANHLLWMNLKYMEMNQFACTFFLSEKFYPTTNQAKVHTKKHIMWDTL